MMIYPGIIGQLPCGTHSFSGWALYYGISLFIAGLNFLPLWSNAVNQNYLPLSTVYNLIVCYLLSLPFLFEYLMDAILSCISFSSTKVTEPKFGNFVLLLSLFLPVFTVNGKFEHASSPYSVMFINCFVSFLQSLVIIGQYDKLQFRSNGFWKTDGCVGTVFLFVTSQVTLNFGIAKAPDNLEQLTTPMTWLFGVSLALSILCFVSHVTFSKKYMVSVLFGSHSSVPIYSDWKVDDYVTIVLQSITFVYFIINILGSLFFVLKKYDYMYHLNSSIIAHIVLGLMASILPGRVLRKNFILLNDKMAIKDTFIRYVSHEIRSPLSTTSLGLNYLLDKLKTEEIKLSEVLEVVQESVVTCELAMNTLNDFLMLDKIQNNMVEINTSMRQASEFMMEAIRPFTLQASSSHVTLSCSVESFDGIVGRDVKIDIDTYKMNQVLRNLLSNAFKFTPDGGSVTATMTVHEDTPDDIKANQISDPALIQYLDGRKNSVRIEVKDSGCGISAENLPRLFGQYVQFDAAKLQGGKGSGLGLWLSKAIVEMHGGRIGAESEGEGQGCAFWIELPCVLSESDRMEAQKHQADPMAFVKRTFSVNNPDVLPNNKIDLHSTRSLEDQATGKVPDLERGDDKVADFRLEMRSLLQNDATPPEVMPLRRQFVDLIATPQVSKLSRYRSISSSMGPLRVLLVDDSAIARKMVERSLTTIGVVCTHAHNGREAVEKVRRSTTVDDATGAAFTGGGYDVILMDYHMPEMSGPEAVEVIRCELGFKGVIIGVSGNVSSEGEFEALNLVGKINKVMVKPFNLELFVDYMNSAVK